MAGLIDIVAGLLLVMLLNMVVLKNYAGSGLACYGLLQHLKVSFV